MIKPHLIVGLASGKTFHNKQVTGVTSRPSHVTQWRDIFNEAQLSSKKTHKLHAIKCLSIIGS